MSDNKFTTGELDKLFPDGIPMVLMKLIFPEKSEDLTIGEIRQIARAIAQQPLSVQEGWKMVPVKPTTAMIDAAVEAPVSVSYSEAAHCWHHMLSAAPTVGGKE